METSYKSRGKKKHATILNINTSNETKLSQGFHIEKQNDKTLQMEIDYGRIKIYNTTNTYDENIRILKCLTCLYESIKKSSIKIHLARKHNELQIHHNVKCPYCPKSFIDLGSLNTHLYRKQNCSYIKENILFNDWRQTWKDICEKNVLF